MTATGIPIATPSLFLDSGLDADWWGNGDVSDSVGGGGVDELTKESLE